MQRLRNYDIAWTSLVNAKSCNFQGRTLGEAPSFKKNNPRRDWRANNERTRDAKNNGRKNDI